MNYINRNVGVCGSLFVAVLMSTGCALFHGNRLDVRHISVVADDDANQGMATALDIVFIYDDDFVRTLPTESSDWFSDRFRWIHLNPEEIDVTHLELPPGRTIQKVDLPKGYKKSIAVLVYASHLFPGGRIRLDITGLASPVIRIGSVSISVNHNGQGEGL